MMGVSGMGGVGSAALGAAGVSAPSAVGASQTPTPAAAAAAALPVTPVPAVAALRAPPPGALVAYDPGAFFGEGQDVFATSTPDPAEATVHQMTALRAFQAHVEAFKTRDEMVKSLLDVTA